MKTWKKLTVLLVLLVAFSAIAATQYVRTTASLELKIDTKESRVQFMAGDGGIDGGYCLDDSNGDGVYIVKIGTWMEGACKVWSASFAIVNTEQNVKLRITRVVIGPAGAWDDYVDIYLHKTPTRYCTGSLYIYPAAAAGTEAAANYKQYWDGGGTPEMITHYSDSSDPGWVLAGGYGPYTTGSPFQYSGDKSAGSYTASWQSTYNVYRYGGPTPALTDTLNTASDLTNDANSDSNIVWVEIDMIIPTNVDGTVTPPTGASVEIVMEAL